jgi:enoyl-CoA hydratase/carnithine racemase
LPRLVGAQKAAALVYTGRRIGGEEAVAIGLADVLVERAEVRDKAIELAGEIAVSSPTVVRGLRATLRDGLLAAVREAVVRESARQHGDFRSADFKEGVAAMAALRPPVFRGE